MEWQQLEYFYTVAMMEHMTRAAEVLSISQPALSRSIARLEQELGVPLFERQGRTIVLNRYGRLFLIRVERILKEFREGKEEIQQLQDPNQGEVSLGFLHTLGTHIIPDLIGAFRAQYPKVGFLLNQNNTLSLTKQLEHGEIDLCFVSSAETKPDIHWVELWNEELYIFVPKKHPLATHESITLQEIANEPLISFKKGFGLRKVTDRLYSEAGMAPKITFEGEEVATIAGLVAAGLGIALIPDVDGLSRKDLQKITVKSPKCRRVIGMAWVEGRYLSPATKQFRQFVMDHFALLK